jgi:hypothetical protein
VLNCGAILLTTIRSQRGMIKERELNDKYQKNKTGQPVNFGDVIQVRYVCIRS